MLEHIFLTLRLKRSPTISNFNNMYKLFTIAFLSFLTIQGMAQDDGFAFGIKGGISAGFQKWNGFERDPLFKYHGIAYIESIAEDSPFGMFLQAGYHARGSAIRNQNASNIFNGQVYRIPTREFLFNNLALTVGFKNKLDLSGTTAYYLLGLRGEYTISTNLDEYNSINSVYPIYPFPARVRKLNYGVTIGGGFEWMFSDLVGGIAELTVNPDFSRQYEQAAIPNVISPFNGETRTIPERIIRNITVELTVGIRLLRRVEYID